MDINILYGNNDNPQAMLEDLIHLASGRELHYELLTVGDKQYIAYSSEQFNLQEAYMLLESENKYGT